MPFVDAKPERSREAMRNTTRDNLLMANDYKRGMLEPPFALSLTSWHSMRLRLPSGLRDLPNDSENSQVYDEESGVSMSYMRVDGCGDSLCSLNSLTIIMAGTFGESLLGFQIPKISHSNAMFLCLKVSRDRLPRAIVLTCHLDPLDSLSAIHQQSRVPSKVYSTCLTILLPKRLAKYAACPVALAMLLLLRYLASTWKVPSSNGHLPSGSTWHLQPSL